jgi:hypothetical protein
MIDNTETICHDKYEIGYHVPIPFTIYEFVTLLSFKLTVSEIMFMLWPITLQYI